MKVWTLNDSIPYEGVYVIAIFSEYGKALEKMETYTKREQSYMEIEEWEVDE